MDILNSKKSSFGTTHLEPPFSNVIAILDDVKKTESSQVTYVVYNETVGNY